MEIIRALSTDSAAPVVMTIGNFDGMHTGHRHLMAQVCAAARALPNALPAAMTFEPHPLAVLRPGAAPARINGRGEKLRQLRDCGIQRLHLPRFTAKLAALPAETFADFLFTRLQVRHLIVGENFRFGSGGRGDFALLQKAAAAAGATATAAALLHLGGAPVSSGRVRDCLQSGRFTDAAALLGRPWTLSARVRRGAARGREWGFPTANLALTHTPPLRGIFAARATIGNDSGDGETRPAAVSIGVNPTVSDENIVRVEAHLLDFDGDLYGKPLRLQPLEKIRDEQKYDSIAALKTAIADDIARTRAIAAAA